MDISNVGFEIRNFGYLSSRRVDGLGKIHGFDIDGSLEIGESKDLFTGSMQFIPKQQKVSSMSIITEKRIATYNVFESLLNLRSLAVDDFSIRGKVNGGDINEIVAVLGHNAEVQLGNLSFSASQEASAESSVSSLNAPFFKDYLGIINLLVVHALVMQDAVLDPNLIADLNDYIRDLRV